MHAQYIQQRAIATHTSGAPSTTTTLADATSAYSHQYPLVFITVEVEKPQIKVPVLLVGG